jgi:hypothetical protein
MVEKKGAYVKVGIWEKTPEDIAVFSDRLYIGSPFINLDETIEKVRKALLALKKEIL